MNINVCRHVGICVSMHAFASAYRYKYAWVCTITHVLKCMLQHLIILPLIAIHVIFILLLSTSVQFYIITLLYVHCILQLCVFLLLSMLYIDCTRDKSEMTPIKTYIYIYIYNIYTVNFFTPNAVRNIGLIITCRILVVYAQWYHSTMQRCNVWRSTPCIGKDWRFVRNWSAA